MNVDTGAFAALTEQIDALTTRIVQLEHDAFMLRSMEQMFFENSRWSPSRGSQPAQVRHLRPVDGSQS